MTADDVDLDSPEANADPHGLFRRLRARGPLLRSERHRAWLFLGHAETVAGFRDPRLLSERIPAFERAAVRSGPGFDAVVDLFRGWMVFRDPPAHTALRDPVRRAFTPRSVERLAGPITRFCDALLDDAAGRGTCDWREGVARPLPALVIAELLGVPPADREQFQRWSDELATVVFQLESRHIEPARAVAAARRFREYFGELVSFYARRPADNLISRLVAARGGLSDLELVGACTLLLFGGHETTTTLLSNALATLLAHPDALARLRAGPDLDASAVEELLRFEGPAKAMVRRVGETHERAGRRLEAGDRVYLGILAANRDPAVFERPDDLDLARHPNPHLGFGWGLHHCLGAPLARLETRIALRRLLDRFSVIEPVGPPPAWVGGPLGRGVVGPTVRLA